MHIRGVVNNISNIFIGLTTCPDGWQPTYDAQGELVDPCITGIDTINCSRCENGIVESYTYEGTTCPEDWQPTYDIEGIFVDPCLQGYTAPIDCSYCDQGSAISMMFGEYEFAQGMWNGINCPDGWVQTGEEDPCGELGPTWKCIGTTLSGSCIQVFDGSGSFYTQAECQAACGSGENTGETIEEEITGETTGETITIPGGEVPAGETSAPPSGPIPEEPTYG